MGYISLWGSDFAASKGCSMYKVSSQSHIINAIIKVDHWSTFIIAFTPNFLLIPAEASSWIVSAL